MHVSCFPPQSSPLMLPRTPPRQYSPVALNSCILGPAILPVFPILYWRNSPQHWTVLIPTGLHPATNYYETSYLLTLYFCGDSNLSTVSACIRNTGVADRWTKTAHSYTTNLLRNQAKNIYLKSRMKFLFRSKWKCCNNSQSIPPITSSYML